MLLQLYDRIAKDIGKFLVDLCEPPRQIGQCDGHRGLVKYCAQANFTGVQGSFGVAPCRHIAKNHHDAGQHTRAILNRGGTVFDGRDGTVPADERGVMVQTDNPPFPQYFSDRAFHRLTRTLIDERKYL